MDQKTQIKLCLVLLKLLKFLADSRTRLILNRYLYHSIRGVSNERCYKLVG